VVGLASVAVHDRGWFEHGYPSRAAAAAAAAAGTGGRVLADEQFADWLLFEHPELAGRVAYDIRYELLRRSDLRAVVDFRKERGRLWPQLALGYGVLVLDPSGDRGAVSLFRRLGARVLYRDGNAVVVRR
jgi:hypothetical protein